MKLAWTHVGEFAIELKTGKSKGRRTVTVPITTALRDLLDIMRAAMKAGVPFGGMEIRPDGTVALFTQASEPSPISAMDKELEDWRRSNGKH